ncbi:MAG: hypothetical protein CMH52_00030 [Myxococcales bacterium]|nr:hypothetical protein [Myxococcales bacterium]
MQYQNKSLTDSLNPELTRLLQNCRDSRSVSALLETIQRPLFDRLKIEAISLAIVDEPIIYVTSIKPLSAQFKEQIIGHNGRCLPSLPIGRDSDDAMDTLQQVGVVIDPKPIGDLARIAWTGALESRGHLMAVVTFYSDESCSLTDTQVNLLREVRACMVDALIKFGRIRHETPAVVETNVRSPNIVLIKLVDDSRTTGPADVMAQRWVRALLVQMISEQLDTQVHTSTFGHNLIAVITEGVRADQHRLVWTERLLKFESIINKRLRVEFRIKAQFGSSIGQARFIAPVEILSPEPPVMSAFDRIKDVI